MEIAKYSLKRRPAKKFFIFYYFSFTLTRNASGGSVIYSYITEEAPSPLLPPCPYYPQITV